MKEGEARRELSGGTVSVRVTAGSGIAERSAISVRVSEEEGSESEMTIG